MRGLKPPLYWSRKTSIGSTRAARIAGTAQATADTAAAVHYNPAGLTQLEEAEAQINVYAINLGNEVTTAAGSFESKSEWQAAPSIYFGQPIYDDLAWGFALTSPFGMGNEWGHGSPFRTETLRDGTMHGKSVLYKNSQPVTTLTYWSGTLID